MRPTIDPALAILLSLGMSACVVDGEIAGAGDPDEAPSADAADPEADEPDPYAGYDGDGEDETPLPDEAQPGTRACGSAPIELSEAPDVGIGGVARPVGSVPIRVRFHVIRSGKSADQGNVAPERIEAQLAVLNAAYAATPFRFVLADVTRTTDDRWYRMGREGERDAKRALHRGDRAVLNVYTAKPGDDSLGWATFPWGKQDEAQDGVVLDHRTLPGGVFAAYSLGDTAAHEVGHWLGLFHTFQGACGERGDRVADTPAELEPAYGCPLGRDSCPELPGLDAVDNLMNYGDDACISTFTTEQILRMDAQHIAFRS